MVSAESVGLAIKKLLSGMEVPSVGPVAQVVPDSVSAWGWDEDVIIARLVNVQIRLLAAHWGWLSKWYRVSVAVLW